MKKLKKLSLKKEVIVNLNDSEMNQIQGGSSLACSIAVSVAVVSVTYDVGKEASLYFCEETPEEPPVGPPPPEMSKEFIWNGDQQSCLLDDVDVYGFGPEPDVTGGK